MLEQIARRPIALPTQPSANTTEISKTDLRRRTAVHPVAGTRGGMPTAAIRLSAS